MAPTPPPFAKATYWDERFSKNPSSFDWLLPANSLDGPILDAIQSSGTPAPRILHVGCGTSVLSLHLRTHVDDPHQVHNTDFSRVAIQLGARWEREVFEPVPDDQSHVDGKGKAPAQDAAPTPPPERQDGIKTPPGLFDTDDADDGVDDDAPHPPRMRWSTLDLLSLPSILSLSTAPAHTPYDIIVDKSTCDAIACGEDVVIPLPYPLHSPTTIITADGSTAAPAANTSSDLYTPPPTMPIHPLHILAIHLAALARPGTRWIALSYAAQRWPFLSPYPAMREEGRLDEAVVAKGLLPHPERLWRLEKREAVEAPEQREEVEVKKDGEGGSERVVHKPRVSHWLYVFVRTEVDVARRAE